MKILINSAMLILSFSLLGGCWDRTELNDLALISALAFDKEENNLIKVTAQIIVPQSQSGGGMGGAGGGGGGAAKHTTIRSGKGINIAEALSKLQRGTPRRLFWGQCKVFIFSDTLAKAGIREHLDFLIRHPQPREHGYIFINKGNAADSLELTPPIERSSAEVLRKLTELNIGIRVTFLQLNAMLRGDSRSASIPMIKILPQLKSAKPFETIPYILGTAVFKKDKMVGEISEKITRGILWINNEIKEYTITFKVADDEGNGDKKENNVSLNPVKASVNLIPSIEGDKWRMTVKVRTEGSIVQNGTSINPMNPDLLKIFEKSFENAIKEHIQLTLHEVQNRLKVDIISFAKAFHRKYPKQWAKEKDHWEEIFPKVEVMLDVKARILRPGLINAPGGLPVEEVKEK